MKKVELSDLLLVLKTQPSALKETIHSIRDTPGLSPEILGFIELFDQLNGDCDQLQLAIATTRQHILAALPTKPKRRFSSAKKIRFAAILVVLISCGIFGVRYFHATNFQFKNIFKDPGIPTYMSHNTENQLETVMFYYRKNDIHKAHSLMQPIYQQHVTNDTVLYYSGLLELLIHQDRKAIPFFQKALKMPSIFRTKAYYFLAVAHVHLKEFPQAINDFETVILAEDESVKIFAEENKKELQAYLTCQE
jgi:tetratricopeptide (TPR) repeat protein